MEHNEAERLEKIEYLRGKADVSYQEAADLLDRFEGDVTRALIELERSDRLGRRGRGYKEDRYYRYDERNERNAKKMNGAYQYQYETPGHGSFRARHPKLGRIADFLFKKHILISRGERTLVDLPVGVYLLLILMGIPFMPMLMLMFVALLVFGCRIQVVREPGVIDEHEVHDFARNAARTVVSTLSKASDTINKTFKEAAAKGGTDASDEPKPSGDDEITIE